MTCPPVRGPVGPPRWLDKQLVRLDRRDSSQFCHTWTTPGPASIIATLSERGLIVSILAGSVDAVIGVDTHRDTLAAAVVTPVGAVVAEHQVTASADGYRALLEFGQAQVPGTRSWAVEGAGSYGAGLSVFLSEHGEQVVEVARPQRPARAAGRKSDGIDAVRAAREALSRDHLSMPRSRGNREALRVLMSTRASAVTARTRAINHLKALIVSAPEELRAELRGKTSDAQITYCAALRPRPSRNLEHRATVRVLRSTAQRILMLRQEADELEAEIQPLVTAMQPQLLALPGVGPISGAQILISWSHPGRFRSEAAFASFSGAAPIPASSGLTNRHRLNRSGDRQLNRALHTIVLARTRIDPITRSYIARRTSEGKSVREAKRCLKRTLARQLYKLLEPPTPAGTGRTTRPPAPAAGQQTGPTMPLDET
jgi:transposase